MLYYLPWLVCREGERSIVGYDDSDRATDLLPTKPTNRHNRHTRDPPPPINRSHRINRSPQGPLSGPGQQPNATHLSLSRPKLAPAGTHSEASLARSRNPRAAALLPSRKLSPGEESRREARRIQLFCASAASEAATAERHSPSRIERRPQNPPHHIGAASEACRRSMDKRRWGSNASPRLCVPKHLSNPRSSEATKRKAFFAVGWACGLDHASHTHPTHTNDSPPITRHATGKEGQATHT